MAIITIDIEDRSFVKQGSGPIRSAVDLFLSQPMSDVGEFSFKMPAADANADRLSVKLSVLRIYIDGAMKFLGVVEAISRYMSEDGVVWLDVTGRDLMSVEFSESLAGIDSLDDSPIAPYLIRPGGGTGKPTWQFVYRPASSWVAYTTGPLTTALVYGRFWGESALGAFLKLTERTNEQWVYMPEVDGDRNLRWVGTYYEDSGVRAIVGAGEPVQAEGNENVCFIQSIERITDGFGIINRIQPYGAGNAGARLTLAASTETISGVTIDTTANTITHDDGVTATGGRYFDKRLEFKDIAPLSNTDADLEAAANYLARAGAAWLERNAEEHEYYRLTVAKLPASVRPGTRIRLVRGDSTFAVNSLFNVLKLETRVSRDGAILHRLDVSETSKFLPGAGEIVASIAEQGQVYIAHPQMNANLDTVSYSGVSFDDTNPANLFFVLGPAITQLNQVMLYYRVDPLRSEVETVAGSASVDVDVTLTGHTHTVPNHGHTILLTSAGTPTYPIGFGAAGTAGGLVFNSGAGGDINYPTDAGSGGTTSASGGSGTASGTIDLSSAISATYGIFEDSGGTVETTSGAVVKVNGTTVTGSLLSGSWYEVDITSELASSTTGRPTAETNEVTVTASSGKRGRVTAHIEIRSVIQAIAYS